ncbi:M48 family metalloprotease [Candidatus Saccharibacteria bacterium]|nr:M48 family metalloprotease [Candidatus Saccharibacteria bacterium]
MYSQIAANKRKTFYIMSLFVLVIGAMGYAYSLYVGDLTSMYVVLGFALFYTLISYFVSSKVALAVNGAKQIEKKDNPRLYRTVENLSIATGMPMPKVYVINDKAPNAFATGRDPNHASVAATTGLLDIMNDSELEGVMAHEMGHVQNYDIRVMMIVFACVSIIGLLSDFLLRIMWFGGDDDNGGSPLTLVLALVMAILAPLVAMMVQMAVSRRREYLADATGALTTRYPDGLASALKKLETHSTALRRQNSSTAHLFFANPLKGKSMAKLFSTHPPIEDRIAKLNEMGGKL